MILAEINKMRHCSFLLPPPGDEVVRECLDEIIKLQTFIARVLCGSDWTKEELKELAENLNIKLED